MLAQSEAPTAGHPAVAAAGAESDLTNVDGVVLWRLRARSRDSGPLVLSNDLTDFLVA